MNTFQVTPVGKIQRQNDRIFVQIDDSYRPALKGLDTFSHVIVHWWAERFDQPDIRQTLVTPLPYAANREAGVFASRSPVRPNLIMTTVCKILKVSDSAVEIANIDAFDGTPVLDLKPYFPVVDRVQDAHISADLVGWPEWMPETGIGLMEGES